MWIEVVDVGDELDSLPALGQTIILYANGVVQRETWELNLDGDENSADYYWARDHFEGGVKVKAGHQWMALPMSPVGAGN